MESKCNYSFFCGREQATTIESLMIRCIYCAVKSTSLIPWLMVTDEWLKQTIVNMVGHRNLLEVHSSLKSPSINQTCLSCKNSNFVSVCLIKQTECFCFLSVIPAFLIIPRNESRDGQDIPLQETMVKPEYDIFIHLPIFFYKFNSFIKSLLPEF